VAQKRQRRIEREQTGKAQALELPLGVKLRHTLRGHQDRIGRIVWSPDGQIIASPSEDGTIRLWDFETGVLIRTLEEPSERLFSVTWSPDSRLLAVKLREKVILWDPASNKRVRTFGVPGLSFETGIISWSPPGNVLALIEESHILTLFDSKTFRRKRKVQAGPRSGYSGLAWSPNGKILAFEYGSGVGLLNLSTPEGI
jgi:WD40 repeat protein